MLGGSGTRLRVGCIRPGDSRRLLGYLGFLVVPPAIGFVAEALGLGAALFIVVILSAAIARLVQAPGGAKPDGRNGNSVR